MRVLITGLGLVTPLGQEPDALWARLRDGTVVLASEDDLAGLPSALCGRVGPVDLRAWLRRRKDRKLLSRAAELALPAAGRALGGWAGDRVGLGLFVGVGREPPDTGSAEPALVAACIDGRLDPTALAGAGRELYPPLLPLLTLPNLVLSHVSINLGVMGPNGTVAGEAAAGLGALAEACHAIAEGRCPAALAGAADSRVDFGTARDLYRLGRAGPARSPAEGAVFLLLEPEGSASPALATITGVRRSPSAGDLPLPPRVLCGDLGAADGLLALAAALLAERWGWVEASDDEGGQVAIALQPPPGPGRDTLPAVPSEGDPR
ncbi:MAG: beta-ketoacyl synthase N-terminal-like domain-containing protein [Pseudomonadota bacterium]